MADLNQITVNVNDIIPPDNFATVDAGSKIGSVYTKEQDNAWRKEVEENTTSGIKGIAKPDDTVPTTGFFRMLADTVTIYTNYIGANDAPIEVTDTDLNIVNGVQRNEVIFEVTNGVTEKKVFAKVGADGANGTATIPKWVAVDYSPDAMVVDSFIQYIAPNGALATDVPRESDKWIIIGSKVSSILIPSDEIDSLNGKAVSTFVEQSRNLFTDPYFRWLESINGADRELNSISNAPRGYVSDEVNYERNIVVSDATVSTYVGLNFNLSDLSLVVGDNLTIGISAKSETSRARIYVIFYNASGTQVGTTVYSEGTPPASIVNYTLFKITTAIPSDAVRFMIGLQRISGTDLIFFTGLGIFKGTNTFPLIHDKAPVVDPNVTYKSDKFFNTVEKITNSSYSVLTTSGVSSISKKYNLYNGLQNYYLKKTGGTTGSLILVPPSNFNKSIPTYVLLPVYIADPTNITNIELQIRNIGSGTNESWARSVTNTWLPNRTLKKGWNLLRWQTGDSTYTNFGNQISRFFINVYSDASNVVEIYTPGVYFEYASKCKMLMTLDHARNSGWHEAHKVETQTTSGFQDAEAMGMLLTIAMNPKKVDTGDPVRLSMAELEGMKERKIFRWNFHSWNATPTSTMTLDDLKLDTQLCVNWLQQKGFGKPQWRSVFTQNKAPQGRNILGFMDLTSLASSGDNSNAPLCGFPLQDRSNIGRFQIHGKSTAQIDDYFTRLKLFKGLTIPYTHGIYYTTAEATSQFSMTLAQWQYFRDKCQIAVSEGWLEFVGYEELKAELTKFSIEDNDESVIKKYFELL